MRRWFDAHLDLACLAENGRDMHQTAAVCGGLWQPASLTFRTMAEGGIAACLGTIFTEANGDDAVRYPAGDAQAAHRAGLAQLERYKGWDADGTIRAAHATGGRVQWPVGRGPVALGILMECADPIREPRELGWWADRGVIAVGMAWGRGSRYAAGNAEPSCSLPHGLTVSGKELVREMDARGVVHDASHLSDRALSDLLALTERPVIASHSNCRSLLDGVSQRHLTDDAIAEIGRRGGVIGLNLVRSFIRTGLRRDDPNDRPSVDEAVAHVEHICGLHGHRRGVGMGSDLDGGISANDLPAGVNEPRDFEKIAEAMLRRGWSEEDVDAFAWGNWARFWGVHG